MLTQKSLSYTTTPTPLGLIMLAATDQGVCFLQFGESSEELYESLAHQYPNYILNPDTNSQAKKYAEKTNLYLQGKTVLLDLPLDLNGTVFQQKVWQYLQTIPKGNLISYTDVAKAIGKPKSVRAVANACAKNNIAIAIPCHRVVRNDGGFAGYRWGVERKKALIGLEVKIKK